MRSRLLPLALAAGLFACSQDQGTSTTTAGTPSVPMASAAAIADATAHAPWLRERLPAETIAYVRLPSLWGLLAAPSGRASDAMYANQAAVDAMASIRKALISDELLKQLGEGPIRMLEALASPIELAMVAPGKTASPAASALFSVRLKAADAAAAAKLITDAGGGMLGTVAFDAQGYASINPGGSPVFLHFNATEQRLSLLGGMFATAEALKALIDEIGKAQDNHPMRTLERRIDEGGQGLVLWMDAAAARPMLMSGLTPDQEWMRPALLKAKAVAFGWGTANGQGNFALRMEFDQAPWGDYLRKGPHTFDAKAAGDPDWVVTGVTPGPTEMRALFDWVLSVDPKQDAPKSYDEVEAEVAKFTGLGLSEWIKPFAGPWVLVGDSAGSWQAAKLADAAALDKVVDTVVTKMGAKHSTHTHAGKTIRHLQLPSTNDLAAALGNAPAVDTETKLFLDLYGRMKTHLYWYEDAGWIYIASVPQPLIERLDRGASTDVAQWLTRTQKTGREHALFSASSQLNNIPRAAYAVNLEIVQLLGDLTGGSVDMFKLPTAQQLAMPESTPIGIEIDVDAGQLALQLNYEYTALEGLGAGGGVATIAVVGILAAIAVPAYNDYTVRAKVSEAISAASSLKLSISEYYMSTGTLPTTAEEIGMELPMRAGSAPATIDIDAGAIYIRFDDDATGEIAGQYFYLLPETDENGYISWGCAYAAGTSGLESLITMQDDVAVATLDEKYLPASCR